MGGIEKTRRGVTGDLSYGRLRIREFEFNGVKTTMVMMPEFGGKKRKKSRRKGTGGL